MSVTLTGKILKSAGNSQERANGEYSVFPDQVYLEDHSGCLALNHFASMELPEHKCSTAVCYADHTGLLHSEDSYDHHYLFNLCRKFGLKYFPAGTGICHVLHTELYAFPGSIIIGANSHTPHCGGIGALSFGVGGLDAAAVLAGYPYYFAYRAIISIRLTGRLNPWCTVKDLALYLLKLLRVNGGAGKIIEFDGPGIKNLTVPERCILTNMCVELGAVTALFPSDEVTHEFMQLMGRASEWQPLLPDGNAEYSDTITIDLTAVEPLIALPGGPDRVESVRSVAGTAVHQVMIGGCTSGFISDFQAVSNLLGEDRVNPGVSCFCQPGSISIIDALSESGILTKLISGGFMLEAPTCDTCVGIGKVPAPGTKSLRTISRNYRGRSGLIEDAVYLCSAETATASALEGRITDPRDYAEKKAISYEKKDICTAQDYRELYGKKSGEYDNLAHLCLPVNTTPSGSPLPDITEGRILIKLGDYVSTDSIIPISSCIKGYSSSIHEVTRYMFHRIDPLLPARAEEYGSSFIIGGMHYGQGSAREWAALAPMVLGVKGVICKSIAGRYVNNLVNFGLLPLIFLNASDYDDAEQNDVLRIEGVDQLLSVGEGVVINATKNSRYRIRISASERQADIIRAGGLSGYIRNRS